jgi:hypothetical protein
LLIDNSDSVKNEAIAEYYGPGVIAYEQQQHQVAEVPEVLHDVIIVH